MPVEKGTLEKLDDKIQSMAQKSPVSVIAKSAAAQTGNNREKKDPVFSRDQIMFGAADRIENLLPRN